MSQAHPLDEIKDMLVEKIQEQRQILRDALMPEGTRPPFSTQLSTDKALAWWSKHRYDDIGQAVIQRMKPEAILELDVALGEHNAQEMYGGTFSIGGE